MSGSCDGHLKVWSRNLSPIWDFDMCQAKPACSNPMLRSVCWDVAENRFLAGTKGGEVYEISQQSGDTNLVLESHYEHSLFGLATHPTMPHVLATAGEDCTLRVWNSHQHELVPPYCGIYLFKEMNIDWQGCFGYTYQVGHLCCRWQVDCCGTGQCCSNIGAAVERWRGI